MKKILALVLSIAAILSFVACEAGTVPPVYGKTVVSVTYADSANYIVGETLNPADVTLRVVYDDGTEATFTGAELGLKPVAERSTYVLVGTSTQYEVAYGTDKKGNQPAEPWKVNVPAVKYSDTEIAIDPSNAVKEVVVDTPNLTPYLPGLGYVVTFKDGTSKTINPAEIYEPEKNWISITDASFVYDFSEEGDVTVELADTVADYITISPEWNVEVVDALSVDYEFRLALKDGFEIFEKGSNKLSDLRANIEVYASVNGVEIPTPVSSSDATYTFDDYDESIKVQDYVKSYDVTVKFEGEQYPATFSFEYTKDYPRTVVATAPTKAYHDEDTILPGDFTYTYSNWASTYTKYTDSEVAALVDSSYFTVNNALILKGEQQASESTRVATTSISWKNPDQTVNVTINGSIKLAGKTTN